MARDVIYVTKIRSISRPAQFWCSLQNASGGSVFTVIGLLGGALWWFKMIVSILAVPLPSADTRIANDYSEKREILKRRSISWAARLNASLLRRLRFLASRDRDKHRFNHGE